MKLLTHLFRKHVNSTSKKLVFWIVTPIVTLVFLPFIIGITLTYLAWTKIQSKSVKLATAFTVVIITLLIGSSWVSGFFSPTIDKTANEEFYPNKEVLSESAKTVSTTTQTDTPTPTNAPAPATPQMSPTPIPTEIKTDNKQTFRVVKVVDGDTIAVDINGVTESIRLIGIDTPETVDPRKPVQCFGVEASNKAKSVLDGKVVTLESDSTQGDRDKYGRLLRYVFLEDGTHFNKLMIIEGYAFEYTYQLPYKYQNEFKQAEIEARETKRGLWADDTCAGNLTPPTPILPTTPPAPPTPTSEPPTTTCDCSGNIYNCPDFPTHAAAQACFEHCGGIDNDVHRLDADKDGIACENLN
ncbi:thermonuclease family protein [Patescibacteria group bacterium]|nr:thermonuclease family protein [Patescibacteria group bacterium]MBU1868590.1 thermonuclease family protein [Patescibacteria group bacterium]